MFYRVPEKRMHVVRWLLTAGWLLLIFSLFYDPISSYLTEPTTEWSIFRLNPDLFDPEKCQTLLTVQGKCLEEKPYPLGAEIFWGIVIPSSIMLLLVLGHETWRRICPLSFLSQIPRALGLQRQRKVVNPRTGVVRYELAKVGKDSWLGRNHLYLQFALLCIGLCLRILFVNSHRILLGCFLILTILSAILVGYLFAGKSWCQYFCPMAPVQMIYTGPRALLGSEAHQGQRQTITQSMCRSVDKEGNEKSACVNCQSPCIDIDAERTYWELLNKPGRRFVQYGYVGLVIGFYLYYVLYSGTLEYYYSGAWNHEENQLATLFNPGFYIFNQPIPIPKIIAAPLTIAVFVVLGYFVGNWIEKTYRSERYRIKKSISQQQAQHVIFSLCTFVVFNIYFMFGGRPILKLFPDYVELGFNALVVIVSTAWLYRTLGRSADTYSKESLANSLRRQLSKLTIDFSKYLDGRSMDDLKPDEVYVLANVLPGVNQEYGIQVYKGVLREALEQGTVNSANSLEVLSQIRLKLGIKDEDHFTVLTELGIEDPDLLDPHKRRSRENQLRLQSYRQALELQLLELVEMGIPLRKALQRKDKQIQALQLEYGITAEEEAQILANMSDENGAILRKADVLLDQLKDLAVRYQLLSNLVPNAQAPAFALLRVLTVEQKQHIIINQLLSILEVLGDGSDAKRIATATSVLAENVITKILQGTDGSASWYERLSAEAIALLQPSESLPKVPTSDELVMLDNEPPTFLSLPDELAPNPIVDERRAVVVDLLKQLLQELDPLIQATALYALAQLDPQEGYKQAQQFLNCGKSGDWLVRETAETILGQGGDRSTMEQTLIARITLMGKTQELVFQQPIVRVGRSQINEIILPDPRISRHHAILYLDGEGVNAIDLGSPQGLYVGTTLVHNERYRLNQGDVIRFSSLPEPAITVCWEKQPVQSQTPSEVLTTLEKLFLLFESSFFRSVKPEALIELACAAELQVYDQGALICKAGEPSSEIMLLIEGSADVTVLQGESEQIVSKVQSGETIGEIGVLTGQQRSASVVTTAEKNRVLVINANNFETVVRQNSELARSLLLILSERLQRLTARVKEQV